MPQDREKSRQEAPLSADRLGETTEAVAPNETHSDKDARGAVKEKIAKGKTPSSSLSRSERTSSSPRSARGSPTRGR